MAPCIYFDIRWARQVFCNGVEVMTLSGTRKEYSVEIYSGNHPFYQGIKTTTITDEGQVNKFKKRFEGLDDLADLTAMNAAQEANTGEGYKDDGLTFDKKLITASKKKKK
jgi:large subunit ribosomal protein L31